MHEKLRILYADDERDKLDTIEQCISDYLSIDSEVLVETVGTNRLVGEGSFYDLLEKEDFDIIFADYDFRQTDKEIKLGSLYSFLFLYEKGQIETSEIVIYTQYTEDLASGKSGVWGKEGPLISKLITHFTRKPVSEIFLPKGSEGRIIKKHLYRALSNWQTKNLSQFRIYAIFRAFESILKESSFGRWEEAAEATLNLLMLEVQDGRSFKYAFPQFAYRINEAVQEKLGRKPSAGTLSRRRKVTEDISLIWGDLSLLISRVNEIYILYRLFRPDINFHAPKESSLHVITHNEIINEVSKARFRFDKAKTAFNSVKNALHPETSKLLTGYLDKMGSTNFTLDALTEVLEEWDQSYKPKLRLVVGEVVSEFRRFCDSNDIALELEVNEPDFSIYANSEIIMTALTKLLEDVVEEYDRSEIQNRKLYVTIRTHNKERLSLSIRDVGKGMDNLRAIFSGERAGGGIMQACADLKYYCDIKVETIYANRYYSYAPCTSQPYVGPIDVPAGSAFTSAQEREMQGTAFTVTFSIPNLNVPRGGHVRSY